MWKKWSKRLPTHLKSKHAIPPHYYHFTTSSISLDNCGLACLSNFISQNFIFNMMWQFLSHMFKLKKGSHIFFNLNFFRNPEIILTSKQKILYPIYIGILSWQPHNLPHVTNCIQGHRLDEQTAQRSSFFLSEKCCTKLDDNSVHVRSWFTWIIINVVKPLLVVSPNSKQISPI